MCKETAQYICQKKKEPRGMVHTHLPEVVYESHGVCFERDCGASRSDENDPKLFRSTMMSTKVVQRSFNLDNEVGNDQ